MEIGLDIQLKAKLPKKIVHFLGWYLAYENAFRKPNPKDLLEKLVYFCIRVAGETLKAIIRIYIFVCVKIFKKDPDKIT